MCQVIRSLGTLPFTGVFLYSENSAGTFLPFQDYYYRQVSLYFLNR